MTNTTDTSEIGNSLSYPERAGAMSKVARKAAFTKAASHLEKFRNVTMNIGELRVTQLNQLRAAGQQFNLGCGREQLSFNLEGLEFARKEILPFMPEGIGVNEIHACVLIAAKMPEPAKTPAEVDSLTRQFQHEFEMLGLAPSHKRKELQNPHARNLFSDFVNRAAGLGVLFEELEKEEAMESWPPDKLDEFLTTTQPVKEKILRAERLRLGKR